jgi:uncharacterized DUF497 family protein
MFAWDPAKAASNRAKHDVSFEEAITVFTDPDALDWTDPMHSIGESRAKRLGKSSRGRILLVVYTVRLTKHESETIRIISARQASRKERAAYARPQD